MDHVTGISTIPGQQWGRGKCRWLPTKQSNNFAYPLYSVSYLWVEKMLNWRHPEIWTQGMRVLQGQRKRLPAEPSNKVHDCPSPKEGQDHLLLAVVLPAIERRESLVSLLLSMFHILEFPLFVHFDLAHLVHQTACYLDCVWERMWMDGYIPLIWTLSGQDKI